MYRYLIRPAMLSTVALLCVWATAAIWFDGPASRALAGTLSGVFLFASSAILLRVRPVYRAAILVFALCAVVLAWWLTIAPRNDRDWQRDVAELPRVERSGGLVTIHNLRNFDYRSATDFTPHWETRTFDLSRLTGTDLFMSYWGSPSIAHTIASWEFDDGQHLAISIETRKEQGEEYSAVLGFFRQFELYYVVADERDVIGLRTNHRDENVYLYRLNLPIAESRAILVDYLEDINRLRQQPRWYNAFNQNCTTTIRMHRKHVGRAAPMDWRILLNGYGDELMYERGMIDTSLPFADVRRRADVTERARAADGDSAFSRRIREPLPSTQ